RSHVQARRPSLAMRIDSSCRRAGSATALSREASSPASALLNGASASGAQQAVADATGSIKGKGLGTHPVCVRDRRSSIIDIHQYLAESGPRSMDFDEGAMIMSRVQLALNVDDVDEAVAFYSTLFGAQPAKRRPG